MSARAGRGTKAPVPDGFYAAPPRTEPDGTAVVRFTGEDGRERVFRFAGLPLPGLHTDLAAALNARIGYGGGRRTQRAASGQWQSARRFLTVLAAAAAPPRRIEDLRVRHMELYRLSLLQTCREDTALKKVQDLMVLLRELPAARMDAQLAEHLARRGHGVIHLQLLHHLTPGERVPLLAAAVVIPLVLFPLTSRIEKT